MMTNTVPGMSSINHSSLVEQSNLIAATRNSINLNTQNHSRGNQNMNFGGPRQSLSNMGQISGNGGGGGIQSSLLSHSNPNIAMEQQFFNADGH